MDVEAFHSAAKERYWQGKDIQAARRLLGEGIALARAQDRPDLEKPLQYDLASFCWPGWDEAGIQIREDDLSAGERAAWDNLRLAGLLGKQGVALARSWFMVGAYDLTRVRLAEAQDAFGHFFFHAASFRDERDENLLQLASGYAVLAGGTQTWGHPLEWSTIIAGLKENGEEGKAYASQLETAARVFGR